MIRSGYGITYHSHPWGAQALRGWFPLTVVAVFSGVNGFQPVTTDPGYVAAGVPNAPLGPDCRHSIDLLPRHQHGPGSAAAGGRDRLSRGQPGAAPRLHPVVEPDRRAQAAGRTGRVDRLRRVGVGQRLRVPRHQRLADTRLRRRGAAALRRSSDAPRQPGSGMAARTATTTRCRPRSIGASRTACCSRARTPTRKAIDEASYSDWTEFSWNAPSVFDRNRALAAHNIPHNFQLALRVRAAVRQREEVGDERRQQRDPRRLAAERPVRAPTRAGRSQLTASDASLNMPGNAQTPDQIKPNVEILGNVGDDGTYFDTSAFARVTEVRFGNVGRNTMRGPGVVNLDLSLFRTFKLTRAVQAAVPGGGVQRRRNTPHFANPNGNVNSSNFGQDPRHADRLCTRSVAGVPLRLASGFLVSRFELASGRSRDGCARVSSSCRHRRPVTCLESLILGSLNP